MDKLLVVYYIHVACINKPDMDMQIILIDIIYRDENITLSIVSGIYKTI